MLTYVIGTSRKEDLVRRVKTYLQRLYPALADRRIDLMVFFDQYAYTATPDIRMNIGPKLKPGEQAADQDKLKSQLEELHAWFQRSRVDSHQNRMIDLYF